MIQLTQPDIDILNQSEKQYYYELELLNSQMQTIDTLQVDLIEGNLNMDSNSDIRTTCNFTFFVKDESYIISNKSKIWLDKFLRINILIVHQRTQSILKYSLGIFMFNENAYQYDASTKTLSISCIDLMGKITGTRNGQIGVTITKISAGSNIRNAMISTLSQLGFVNKYIIGDIGAEYGNSENIYTDLKYNVVPYDLQFTAGGTVYEIISTLRDLYSGWETFFDETGTFVCQKNPDDDDFQPILTDYTLSNLIINESRSNAFEKVKNVTEIWGKFIETNRYSDICSLNGSQYTSIFNELSVLNNYTVFSIKINANNPNSPSLKINNFAAYPIVNSNGSSLKDSVLSKNIVYVFKYLNNKFYFLGEPQIHAVYKDENPESPFNIHQDFGEILDVKVGGDFENIYSNDLAYQRAKYENYLTTRIEDNITLSLILIPWLQVNQKIKYKSKITNKEETYIIKNISFSFLDGTMMVKAIKFYPLYPILSY